MLEVYGSGSAGGFADKVTYIYRLQQQEADVIAINKIDRLTTQQREAVEQLVRSRFPNVALVKFSAVSGEGLESLTSVLRRERSSDGALCDIDYEQYREGEALLGWLNCTLRLAGDSPVDLDVALVSLARKTREAMAECGVQIAHAKFLLRGDRKTAVVSLLASRGEPELAQAANEKSARLDLIVNIRAQADPGVQEQVLNGSLQRWCEEFPLRETSRTGRSFRPPPPVPVHRLGVDA